MQRARVAFAVLLAAVVPAGIASAAGSIDLHDGGDLHEGVGQADLGTKLQPGSTYTASRFPVAVTIRSPDAFWGGVQQESGGYRFVQLGHVHRAGDPPLAGVGYLTLESAAVATPSAARTLANLRATPHMKIGPTKPVTVAGLRGQMFDATVTGVDVTKYCRANRSLCSPGISLEPFLANHECGFCQNTMHRETQDVKFAGVGQVLRIIVLQAHGKAVVIYIESIYADQKRFPPTKMFPTFLPYARKLLAGISFG